MTLDELNLVEIELTREIQKTYGLIDEKLEQLNKLEVFDKYSEIFSEYAQMITNEIDGTEALKRAVFLKWYEFAEPIFLSGINGLPKDESKNVLEKLDIEIKNQNLDYEFSWMLSHYLKIIDYVFDNYENIKNFKIVENKNIWENSDFDLSQFENRGQMGNYWISVISSNIKRLKFNERLNKK